MERHQAGLYLAAIALGAAAGLGLPRLAGPATELINPVLGLLLYATFLSIPVAHLARAVRDWRFLLTLLALNFVLVPPVVFALSRLVADDDALTLGLLFVLLTPCVDYVIVFTGLAGGAKERLLAAAPILLLAQLLALPGLLWLMAGHDVVAHLDLAPFADALVYLILLPLAAAVATQRLAERGGTRIRPAARGLGAAVLGAMVPLMMLTLAVVVASQVHAVSLELGRLARLVPVYAAFGAVMLGAGWLFGRAPAWFGRPGFDIAARRAIVFSGATRNSLVVLPLVLALPAAFDLAPLAVVTQTLVELILMVVLVRIVPRLIPA
ncbi:arsenic resistance protein [Zhihengliuella salsuginis]|nr:bile acid:sodium symporter [Zhihengliuella salsuginis]